MARRKGKKMSAATKAYLRSLKRGGTTRVREDIVVHQGRPATRRRHHSGGGLSLGGIGGSFSPILAPAIAGYAIGKIETSDFWSQVPSLPLLGKKGTVVVAMQFLGVGKAGLFRDIKYGLALLSGYELAKDGVISGSF